MIGYIGEMGSRQFRHFPRSHSQPRTGTLSYGLIGFKQRGHREPGATMEIPSGMREMQTFRKLPMQIPNRKKKKAITPLNVPHPGPRLNAPAHHECPIPNQTPQILTSFLQG
jgi:hypothetical protein